MNGLTACCTGRLGADAGRRHLPSGTTLLQFSVVVDDPKRKEGDAPQWLQIVVWGQKAEELGDRLVKGTEVYCEGKLKLESWEGQDGQRRSTLKLVAWLVQPMGQIGRRAPRPTTRDGHPVGALFPPEVGG